MHMALIQSQFPELSWFESQEKDKQIFGRPFIALDVRGQATQMERGW